LSPVIFLLVVFSAIMHAGWNFTAKKVSGNLSVIFWGLWLTSLACSPFAIYFAIADPESVRDAYSLMLMTGFLTAIYFFVLSKTYKYGDISTVYPVARGSGVAGTSLAGCLLLHESISLSAAAGISLICLGTVLLGYKRIHRESSYTDLLLALFVGLLLTATFIIDKIAMAVVSPVVYIFAMYFLSALFLTPYMFREHREELTKAWQNFKKYSLIIGIGSMCTYSIILFAFKLAQVSYVVATREVSVVIGAFLGFKYLNEKFTPRKVVAIFTIFGGLIMLKI
jgi:drug/metabolite transporter (DMT)-like permease